MDKSWDTTFIEIAEKYAEHSTCSKYHVGAIITRDRRIISTGYNGVPGGQKHCNQIFKNINFKEDRVMSEKHHEWSLKNEIHAEVNAICYAAKNEVLTNNATLYCTLQPCLNCSKAIVAAGIKRVVYKEAYKREPESIDFLKSAGVDVVCLNDTENC
jgi:dCMP deaminase